MIATDLLYTSADIRKAIINLLENSKQRRVVAVAFVGTDAEAFLPKANGLELICWPKEGGTNPDTLRRLMKKGVKVMFSDGLHMKVYWSEDQGVIISSANLSSNALGSGNLKEFGMKLPVGSVDINRIIGSLNARNVTETELRHLDKLHKEYLTRNHRPVLDQGHRISFDQWIELPYPQDWKLGWYDSEGHVSKEAKKIAKKQYDISRINDFLAAGKGDFKVSDWVLTYRIDSPAKVKWLYVDYMARVLKSENEDYPYQAIQVWSKKYYPVPPFKIDARFRRAFSMAIKVFGPQKIMSLNTCRPPKRLLNLINENLN